MRKIFLLFCFHCGITSAAQATTMIKMELPELVAQADKIFVGRVEKVTSRRIGPEQRTVSDATLVVTENIFGTQKGVRLTVRRLGGRIGRIVTYVPGSPEFKVGDRALIFSAVRGGQRVVVGMSQGYFHVFIDKNKKAWTLRKLGGLRLLSRDQRGTVPHTRTPNDLMSPQPLQQLVGQIRTYIGSR